ncbi:MAG: aminopeptidase [Acholeplasma sp.]|nr:aminopeptidase [Acholeplasma sp.]
MPKLSLLEKYAKLAVKVGVNVQKDQVVVVRATTETKELTRLIVKEAYLAGAKKVITQWSDDYLTRYAYDYQSVETLEEIPNYSIEQSRYYVDNNACFINVISPMIGVNQGIDPVKMAKSLTASQKAVPFLREYTMGNKGQWTIVAASNPVWAEAVYPDLKGEEATEALWTAILNACRVYEDSDPIENWHNHNASLEKHNRILNDLNFKELRFKNGLGTDLTVGLVENHVWSGGGEKTTKGVYFNPNIPTEETFTMPYKWATSGKVVATKPLNYQGTLIEDFYLVFEEGKVVEFDAKKEKKTLEEMLNTDENARYIGEIALISHDSPISNTNLLFLNTLYDENASCHMALGRAYPMNIKGGLDTPIEELEKKGYNKSLIHVDFMFGSSDMSIVGIKQDGSEVVVFKDGNFVI